VKAVVPPNNLGKTAITPNAAVQAKGWRARTSQSPTFTILIPIS